MEEYGKDLLDDKAWVDEYTAQDSTDLAKTASDLLGTVNDPKLNNSEVGPFGQTCSKASF